MLTVAEKGKREISATVSDKLMERSASEESSDDETRKKICHPRTFHA